MTIYGSLLLALAAVATPPASQTTTAPVAAVEPARLEKARALMKVMRLEQSYEMMFKDLAPMMASGTLGILAADPETKGPLAALGQQGEGFEVRLLQLLSEEYLASMRSRYPKMIDLTAQEYARTFTLEELRDYVAFYETPSGARMLELHPALQMKLRGIGQTMGQQAGGEAAKRALERAEKEFRPGRDSSGT